MQRSITTPSQILNSLAERPLNASQLKRNARIHGDHNKILLTLLENGMVKKEVQPDPRYRPYNEKVPTLRSLKAQQAADEGRIVLNVTCWIYTLTEKGRDYLRTLKQASFGD